MFGNVLKIFSGNSNRTLADDVVHRLDVTLGRATASRFSDGEINVEIGENVRSSDVFVIQSTCTPGNENLMELLDDDPKRLDGVLIACIGPITSATAREYGLHVDVEPQEHTVPGLVRAVIQHIQAQG